ncbi:MAG: base excision DNA repair protein [Candidatus Korobacteraceae bacterium]
MKRRIAALRKAEGRGRKSSDPQHAVRLIYRKLSRAWGPQHWWPAETPLEVIVGAILTQNTSWTNVEKALANLRAADVLSVGGIRGLPVEELEQLVRPSGYFRQKARRLKEFVQFLDADYGGSLDAMFATPTPRLRERLLAQHGIGPETADSILLYAGNHAVFVVDAYTRRVLERHDAVGAYAKYEGIRGLVEGALRDDLPLPSQTSEALDPKRPTVHPPSAMSTAARSPLAQAFNEMHGLFVQAGKHYCVKRDPKCNECPLGAMLNHPVATEAAT